MTGLLMKDWRLLKIQGRYIGMAVLIICAMVFVGLNDSSFLTSYMTFIVSIFSFSSFSYDEYENGMAFLIALPSGRKNYVREKYIFSFLLVAGGWLIGTLLRMVFFLVHHTPGEYLEVLPFEPVYLLICLMYVGGMIPALIKYGAEKGRSVALTLVALFAMVVFFLAKTGKNLNVLKQIDQLAETSPAMVLGVLAAVCLLLWAVSYQISLQIIKKKEF